jgi:hypothetical protein
MSDEPETAPPSPASDHWPFDASRDEAPLSPGCASWGEFAAAEPELADAVRSRLDATKHHVLATLRTDGSPRVSGTEVILHGDVMAVGSMFGAVKALDLQRDGRFALHANPGDGSMEGGDAKLAGVAAELGGSLAVDLAAHLASAAAEEERPDVPEPFHLFRLDLRQVVLTQVDHERGCLVIRSWSPGTGLVTVDRA